MTDNTRGLGITYASLDGITYPAERFYVRFEKADVTAFEWWDEDFATLAEAREDAEQVVEDGEAIRATITARNQPIYEEYTRSEGWTVSR